MLRRLAQNLFGGWFRLGRWFPAAAMARIAAAIGEGERRHSGEVCFAVESRFPAWQVLAGLTTAARAREVFGQVGAWDTQENTGVLLYLQLAERRIEILADRGIARRVSPGQWEALCACFAGELPKDGAEAAVLACLARVHDMLAAHFPAEADNPREFPDDPIVL
jgi:uncharacterized membrane protein